MLLNRLMMRERLVIQVVRLANRIFNDMKIGSHEHFKRLFIEVSQVIHFFKVSLFGNELSHRILDFLHFVEIKKVFVVFC